jgi:hypothetical protein
MRFREPRRGRSPLFPIASLLFLTLLLTGCRANLPSEVVSDLEDAIEVTQVSTGGTANDFRALMIQTHVEVPASLTAALREADEAIESGRALSDEHEKLLAQARQWESYASRVNVALSEISTIEFQITEDALRLIHGRFLTNASPPAGLQDQLAALEQRVLKGLWCDALHFGLDKAGTEQAALEMPNYEFIGDTAQAVDAFIRANLTASSNFEGVVDVTGLAVDSIKQSNKYLVSAFKVIEAPTGTLAVANLAYFRSCVATAR